MTTPSFTSIARPSPGVQITPAAVLIDSQGKMQTIENPEKLPPTEIVAIKSGGKTGMAQLFIPMTFTLKVPNDRFPVVPLTLYVTPSEIRTTLKKALTEHTIRQGPVREEWGDDLTTWNCSGSIAAFYTPSFGLTQVNRNQTAGYHNFLSLLSFYKVNGRSYYSRSKSASPVDRRDAVSQAMKASAYQNRDQFGARKPSIQPLLKENAAKFKSEARSASSDARRIADLVGRIDARKRGDFLGTYRRNVLNDPSKIIKHVGSVEISYDFWILDGHFDSFDHEDNVDHPHSIKYSFTFTIKRWFDLVAQVTGEGTPNA